jgi:hypothetical protein
MKTLENATKEVARECIMRCAEKYGFDGEEAFSEMFVKVDVVEMKKRGSVKKLVKEVKKDEEEVKSVKSNVIFPFSKERVNELGCCGIAYNQGLFTQCLKKRMEEGKYCKTCQKEADGSASGIPNNGTITERLRVGLMEYRDPKGRSPIRYSKVMEKRGLTRVEVEEEARKLNYNIEEEHFNVEEKDLKRGRPKVDKKKKEITNNDTVENLFAKISFGSEDEDESSSQVTELMTESESEEDKVEKLEKAAKESEKAAAKAAKELEKAAAKAAKESEKAAAKAAKEAEKAAAKAAKDAEKAAAKAAKDAAKAAKEAAKGAKEDADKGVKSSKVSEKAKAEEEEEEPKAKKITVCRITINGVQYLKSTENILYNPNTKEEVGIYDEDTKTIQPIANDSEDEYDELEADGYETN